MFVEVGGVIGIILKNTAGAIISGSVFYRLGQKSERNNQRRLDLECQINVLYSPVVSMIGTCKRSRESFSDDASVGIKLKKIWDTCLELKTRLNDNSGLVHPDDSVIVEGLLREVENLEDKQKVHFGGPKEWDVNHESKLKIGFPPLQEQFQEGMENRLNELQTELANLNKKGFWF